MNPLAKYILTQLSLTLLTGCQSSNSAIKVVQDDSGKGLAFKDNGRLVARQNVFSPGDKMKIEKEEYLFRDSAKITARMNRVCKLHNMAAPEDNSR